MLSAPQPIPAPFVQAALLKITCGGKSGSVDIPPGTKCIVVTNPTKTTSAWVSFGESGSDLTAYDGLGYDLMGESRLIVNDAAKIAKIAAIVTGPGVKNAQNLVVYVELGSVIAPPEPKTKAPTNPPAKGEK